MDLPPAFTPPRQLPGNQLEDEPPEQKMRKQKADRLNDLASKLMAKVHRVSVAKLVLEKKRVDQQSPSATHAQSSTAGTTTSNVSGRHEYSQLIERYGRLPGLAKTQVEGKICLVYIAIEMLTSEMDPVPIIASSINIAARTLPRDKLQFENDHWFSLNDFTAKERDVLLTYFEDQPEWIQHTAQWMFPNMETYIKELEDTTEEWGALLHSVDEDDEEDPQFWSDLATRMGTSVEEAIVLLTEAKKALKEVNDRAMCKKNILEQLYPSAVTCIVRDIHTLLRLKMIKELSMENEKEELELEGGKVEALIENFKPEEVALLDVLKSEIQRSEQEHLNHRAEVFFPNQPALLQAAQPDLLQALQPALLQALLPALLEALQPALLEALQAALLQTLEPALLQTLQPALLQVLQPALLQAPQQLVQAPQETKKELKCKKGKDAKKKAPATTGPCSAVCEPLDVMGKERAEKPHLSKPRVSVAKLDSEKKPVKQQPSSATHAQSSTAAASKGDEGEIEPEVVPVEMRIQPETTQAEKSQR